MINLRITNNREDIRRWTGLPSDNYDKALWDAGFNLDDWDMCIESDTRLLKRVSDVGTTKSNTTASGTTRCITHEESEVEE